MKPQPLRTRRAVLCWLALGTASPLLAAEPGAASAPSGRDEEPKGKPKEKPASLTVQVSGDGKPLAHAEVRVKTASGDVQNRFTQDDGSVALNAISPGKTNVKVIASGWDSGSADVTLKAGQAATLPIKLKK